MDMPDIIDTSLHDYLERYSYLEQLDPDEDQARDLINYALCGIDLRRDSSLIRINMVNNYGLDRQGNLPHISRDYDSLIGFTTEIPIERSLSVLPLPPAHLSSIKSKMHVSVPFTTNKGLEFLDPSEVPNILFAKYDDRHQIRIFFPRLLSDDRDDYLVNQLSKDEASLLWKEAIHPAFAYAAPTLVKDWPTSLQSERWRAKNDGFGYQHSTYLLSSTLLPFFKEKLSELLDNIPEFRDAMFCTHIQGVKADFPHEMFPNEASATLATMLKDLDTSEGHWWIDVGLELQDGGQALLWRETAGARLMSYVLGIPMNQAGIIKRSRAFRPDMNSHLVEIAGFHIAFEQPTGPSQATYMQVYTTDKSLTFHRNGNQFARNLTLHEAMKGFPPPYLAHYLDVLNEAAEKNVAARVEARVPLDFAEVFLMDFDMDVIRSSIVSVKRENFWNHRAMKIQAMTILFSALNSLTRDQILLPPVLSLYAVAIWYTNGVHSRPNDGSSGRECQAVGVPWYDDYDRDFLLNAGYTVAALNDLAARKTGKPFSPLNVQWLRRIYLRPEANVVRMPMIRHLQPAMYKRVFGKTEAELKIQIGTTAIIRRRDLPKERYPANKGMSRPFNGQPPANQPSFPSLEDVVEDPVTIMGPDIQAADNTVYVAPDRTVEEKLQGVLVQFPSCVLQKIGNPKNYTDASYCRLSQEQRQRATLKVMQTRNLAIPFTRVQVLEATEQMWLSSCAAFFPEKGTFANPSSQGWGGMLYYGDWVDLMRSLSDEDAAKVRVAAFDVLKTIGWLPKASSDRPVRTNRMQAPWRLLPSTVVNVPAPQIYLSPFFHQQWRWAPDDPMTDDEDDTPNQPIVLEVEDEEAPNVPHHVARREEEEESEEDDDEDEDVAMEDNPFDNQEEDDAGGNDVGMNEYNDPQASPPSRGPSRAPSSTAEPDQDQGAPNPERSSTGSNRRSLSVPLSLIASFRQGSQRSSSTTSNQRDIRQFLVSPTASETANGRGSLNVNGIQGRVMEMSLSRGSSMRASTVDRGEGSSSGVTKRRRLDDATLAHNQRKIERLKRLNARSAWGDKVERMKQEEEESGDEDLLASDNMIVLSD